MLIPGFYTIENFKQSADRVDVQIRFNPDHEVYAGHFPEQAVVPGVIQLQLIKELVEKSIKKKLQISEMTFAKFLNTIIPTNRPLFDFEISYQEDGQQLRVSTTIKDERLVYTKVKATMSFTD